MSLHEKSSFRAPQKFRLLQKQPPRSRPLRLRIVHRFVGCVQGACSFWYLSALSRFLRRAFSFSCPSGEVPRLRRKRRRRLPYWQRVRPCRLLPETVMVTACPIRKKSPLALM